MHRIALLVLCLGSAVCANAMVAVDEAGEARTLTTRSERFTVHIPNVETAHAIHSVAVLETGSGGVRVLGPDRVEIYQHLWGGGFSEDISRLPVSTPGAYTVEVALTDARGSWRVRVRSLPSQDALKLMYVSPILMMVSALIMAALAVRLLRTPLHGAGPDRPAHSVVRIFLAGCGALALGKLIWFVGAIGFYLLFNFALEDRLPYLAFITTRGGVLGAWEGMAAVAGVLVVARLAPSVQKGYEPALATGMAAAAWELFAIAVLSVLGLGVMFAGAKRETAQFTQAYAMAVTPFLPLADNTLLLFTAMVRAAGTALVAYAVRARSIEPLLPAALVFGGALSAKALAPALDLAGAASDWWLAAMTLPVVVLSLLLLRRNRAQWQQVLQHDEAPMDAFLRRHGDNLVEEP